MLSATWPVCMEGYVLRFFVSWENLKSNLIYKKRENSCQLSSEFVIGAVNVGVN